jgi:hypothetical protein
MDNPIIELIEPLTLVKQDCDPIIFEAGTILKVLMQTPTGFLVSADSNFNFTVANSDEDKVWRLI